MNSNPIHFDAHYASQTEFGRPVGELDPDAGGGHRPLGRRHLAGRLNLGWDEVRMPAPVFEGDTIYAQTEVLSRRESKSRPHMALVEIQKYWRKILREAALQRAADDGVRGAGTAAVATGVYGVMTYVVSRQTRESGSGWP